MTVVGAGLNVNEVRFECFRNGAGESWKAIHLPSGTAVVGGTKNAVLLELTRLVVDGATVAKTADELLAEWILKIGFPEWAKNRCQWATYERDKLAHLYQCPTLRVDGTRHGWECGCYSEYTRDDSWYVHATMACDHHPDGYEFGKELYGSELPEVLRQMSELDEQDFDCPYEDEEE